MTRRAAVCQHSKNYFLSCPVTRRACNYGSTRPVRSSVNQRLPVLETHHIPLEHPGRTMLILSRVISIEERVPKPILFGVPSCSLKRRTCLHALPSAPFNARFDGYGCGCRCHGSPPLLNRISAESAAWLPPCLLMWLSPGLSLPRVRHTLVIVQRGCQGINASCPMPGSIYVSISYSGSIAHPRDDDRILRKAGWGNLQDEVSSPRQTVLLDRIGDHAAELLDSVRRATPVAAHAWFEESPPNPERNSHHERPQHPNSSRRADLPRAPRRARCRAAQPQRPQPPEAATMADWTRKDMASGKVTPEQAAKIFDQLGTPPDQRVTPADLHSDEQ